MGQGAGFRYMSSGNRVEKLENQVAELEATVQGLTEELVEANDRIRQIEAVLGSEAENERSEDAGRTSDHADIVDDDWEPITSSGADPEEVAAAAAAAAEGDKSDEADGGDEREQDDIIVA
jgi:hypothetical protein